MTSSGKIIVMKAMMSGSCFKIIAFAFDLPLTLLLVGHNLIEEVIEGIAV